MPDESTDTLPEMTEAGVQGTLQALIALLEHSIIYGLEWDKEKKMEILANCRVLTRMPPKFFEQTFGE